MSCIPPDCVLSACREGILAFRIAVESARRYPQVSRWPGRGEADQRMSRRAQVTLVLLSLSALVALLLFVEFVVFS